MEVMEVYIYEYHRPKMAKSDEPDVAVMHRYVPGDTESYL